MVSKQKTRAGSAAGGGRAPALGEFSSAAENSAAGGGKTRGRAAALARAERKAPISEQKRAVVERLADSLKHAEALLEGKVTKQQLRIMKRDPKYAHCFRGSRVDLGKLAPLLDQLQPEVPQERTAARPKEIVEADISEEKLSDWRRRNAIEDGRYFEKAKGAEQAAKFLADISPMLDQKLCNEYPAQVAGLSIEEIRKIGRSLAETIKGKIREFARTFTF